MPDPVPIHQTLIGPTDILYGVCEVTDAFGDVISCELKDTADKEEFMDCRNNTKAVLLRNERFELQLEVEFDSLAGKPELGDDIAFPEVGVTGSVLESTIKWERGSLKLLSITATHWKAMGSTPTVTRLAA